MIEFVVDYRGVLTGEMFYRAGDVVQTNNDARLVAAGRARWVEKPQLSVDELRQRARAEGLRGWHNMKPETLRKRLGL